MIRSFPTPFFKKTATGARKIESIISTNLLSMFSPSVFLVIILLLRITLKITGAKKQLGFFQIAPYTRKFVI
jgi:hypothetical protein